MGKGLRGHRRERISVQKGGKRSEEREKIWGDKDLGGKGGKGSQPERGEGF